MGSRIHNPKKMSQLIDFRDCYVGNHMYPTDIDGVIEYKNSEYILFEVKFLHSKVPFSQQLALQRMADDFTKVGKRAIVFICEHNVKNPERPVVLAKCKIRTVYYGGEGRWVTPEKEMLVKEAIEYLNGTHA